LVRLLEHPDWRKIQVQDAALETHRAKEQGGAQADRTTQRAAEESTERR
jgi:hypothetical protein